MKIGRVNPYNTEWLQVYKDLFLSTFGELRSHHSPDIVYLITEEGRAGFAECFINNQNEIHIKYGGTIKGLHGRAENVRAFSALVDYIHGDGFGNIRMDVENDNLPMLKLALASGFRIIGCRIATDKTVVVEMLKMKEN